MTTFTGNKSKRKQKGHLNCSITQPANTDLSPCLLPLGDVLYALCVLATLLYAIVHWLSFRHMSSYRVYSSLEEAFEFCWSTFADEHNT